MVDQRPECRICIHYSFNREVEVESFTCMEGYFDFTDYGNRIEGHQPKSGSPGCDMPCGARKFVLNTNSRWYRNARHSTG
jgi:hypothetical protein